MAQRIVADVVLAGDSKHVVLVQHAPNGREWIAETEVNSADSLPPDCRGDRPPLKLLLAAVPPWDNGLWIKIENEFQSIGRSARLNR
jgi:hypothetical protein